jgi:hypothetical protein
MRSGLHWEQSATIAPRGQLTLARLNIEEQRIGQLAAQLDQGRRELSAASLESQKLSDPRENEMAQALSTEPARWVDLNAHLDEPR